MSEIEAYNADAKLLEAKLVAAGPEFEWRVNDWDAEWWIAAADIDGPPFNQSLLRVNAYTKKRYDRGRIYHETFVARELVDEPAINFPSVVVGWMREEVEYLLNDEEAEYLLKIV